MEINSDPRMNHSVIRLWVFGSYLSDKPLLPRLDIAFALRPRWDPSIAGQSESRRLAFLERYPPPPSMRDFASQLFWPETYAVERLRVGEDMNLHYEGEIEGGRFNREIIFQAS